MCTYTPMIHIICMTVTNISFLFFLYNILSSAYMVYTDLAGLKGLWSPTDYGSGIEYADGVLNLFPSSPDKQLHDTTIQASTGLL